MSEKYYNTSTSELIYLLINWSENFNPLFYEILIQQFPPEYSVLTTIIKVPKKEMDIFELLKYISTTCDYNTAKKFKIAINKMCKYDESFKAAIIHNNITWILKEGQKNISNDTKYNSFRGQIKWYLDHPEITYGLKLLEVDYTGTIVNMYNLYNNKNESLLQFEAIMKYILDNNICPDPNLTEIYYENPFDHSKHKTLIKYSCNNNHPNKIPIVYLTLPQLIDIFNNSDIEYDNLRIENQATWIYLCKLGDSIKKLIFDNSRFILYFH